jgi:hypothetical protein
MHLTQEPAMGHNRAGDNAKARERRRRKALRRQIRSGVSETQPNTTLITRVTHAVTATVHKVGEAVSAAAHKIKEKVS